jgi:hypothetical protein
MAYKQTPGRGNGKKTGGGLSPMLMGGSPMYQKKDPKVEAALSKVRQAEEAAKKRASIKKLSERDRSIEVGAAMDSIEASNKAGDFFTKRQRAQIGNKAANKTRKKSGSSVTVTKTEVTGKKGKEDKYTQTPVKQMSKLGVKKTSMTASASAPKASKKAPMKMKKC